MGICMSILGRRALLRRWVSFFLYPLIFFLFFWSLWLSSGKEKLRSGEEEYECENKTRAT